MWEARFVCQSLPKIETTDDIHPFIHFLLRTYDALQMEHQISKIYSKNIYECFTKRGQVTAKQSLEKGLFYLMVSNGRTFVLELIAKDVKIWKSGSIWKWK